MDPLWLATSICWPAADVAALQACDALNNQVANDLDAPHCQLPTLMHHKVNARWQVKHTARQAQVDAWQHRYDGVVSRQVAPKCIVLSSWCKDDRGSRVQSTGMRPHEGHQVTQSQDLHVPHVQRRQIQQSLMDGP
jgi:hypothetical protein